MSRTHLDSNPDLEKWTWHKIEMSQYVAITPLNLRQRPDFFTSQLRTTLRGAVPMNIEKNTQNQKSQSR